MFGTEHYVPILKGKAGEYGALVDLDAASKDRLTPLIELPPVGWDYKNSTPAKSVDKHLQKVGQNLKKAWAEPRPLFLDSLLPGNTVLSSGGHHLSGVLADARAVGVRIVPVTGIGRDAAYQKAVKAALVKDKLGICLRLRPEHVAGDPQSLGGALESLLSAFGLAPSGVDLLVDLGEIPPNQGVTFAIAAQGIISGLPQLTAWRNVILSGSAFPTSLAGIPRGALLKIERAEWTMWRILASGARSVARTPTFSDYAIQHPEPFEADPRVIKPTASLRYTTDAHWLIVKGPDWKKTGSQAFRTQCKRLMALPEYYGPHHCWGDDYISRCAAGTGSPGNLTTWRRVGTGHHMTVVAGQVAKTYGP